jgi:hypothetical protein
VALAFLESLQRSKAVLPLLCIWIPNEPYLFQALTALGAKGVFIPSLHPGPSPKSNSTLFVAFFYQAMAFAFLESLQRSEAFFPLLRKYVPDKPYLFQALNTLGGKGAFLNALDTNPPPQSVVILFVVLVYQAMAFTGLKFDQHPIPFIPGNPEAVGNLYGDAVNKLIQTNLRPKELYLLQEPLRVERLSLALVLLKLPNDIDKLFVMFPQRVKNVRDGFELLGFNGVIKAVTIYSGDQRV